MSYSTARTVTERDLLAIAVSFVFAWFHATCQFLSVRFTFCVVGTWCVETDKLSVEYDTTRQPATLTLHERSVPPVTVISSSVIERRARSLLHTRLYSDSANLLRQRN